MNHATVNEFTNSNSESVFRAVLSERSNILHIGRATCAVSDVLVSVNNVETDATMLNILYVSSQIQCVPCSLTCKQIDWKQMEHLHAWHNHLK